MDDKPLKPTKKDRIALNKRGFGRVERFRANTRPDFNGDRTVSSRKCVICNFKGIHKLYVCPRCGNCQSCGALNVIGLAQQSCMACGNGTQELLDNPPIEPPMLKSDNYHEEHQSDIKNESKRLKPHKKPQSSASIHITNRNGSA